jgi:hypothetical protein
VNPTGQVVLPSNQVKCKTDLTTVNFTTLNTVGSTSYSWSNSNTNIGLGASGAGNISFTAANATLSPISATIEVTPTFTYGGTSCVGPSKTFTITVNPTGQVNDPTDLVKCNTDLTTTTFTTTNLIGTTTYAWANTNTGIGLGASGTGNISFTAANTGTAPITGTITVTPTFDNGGTICVGPSESFTITVNPTGQVNLPANQVKCNTDATTVTFTTTHTVGLTTYAWSNTNTGIGLGASGTGDISFTAANTGTLPISGTIVVTPTFTYGLTSCVGPTKTFTITVNPTGQVDQPLSLVKCNTVLTTTHFTTQNTVGTTTYEWTNTNTNIGLVASGTGDLSFTATNTTTAPILGTIVVTPVFDNGGVICYGPTKTFTITVNPTGQVDQPTSLRKCNTETTAVTFTTENTVGATTYAWANSNAGIGLAVTGTGNISFAATNATAAPISGTIVVTPTFTYGGTSCVGPTKTFTITINPSGQVNDPANQVVCHNENTAAVVFTTTKTGGTMDYNWSNNLPVLALVLQVQEILLHLQQLT